MFGFGPQDGIFGFAEWGIWDWADWADKTDFCGLAATFFDFFAFGRRKLLNIK